LPYADPHTVFTFLAVSAAGYCIRIPFGCANNVAGAKDGSDLHANSAHAFRTCPSVRSGVLWRKVKGPAMDLRQIMYFLWVFEEQSFTRASKRAGVVQPALSTQIRRLEEEFGIELFQRESRGVTPTAHGKLFYELCSPIRRDLAEARSKMIEAAQPDNVLGTLRCGFPPSFYKSVVPGAIAGFTSRYPLVELELSAGYGHTLTRWVSEEKLDFAVGLWTTDFPELERYQTFEEEIALISGRQLSVPDFARIDIADIANLKLMKPSPSQMLAPHLEELIHSGTITPERTMVVDTYVGVMEIARTSDWVALVPVTGLLDELNTAGLHIYRLKRPFAVFRWDVVHRQGAAPDVAARALIDAIAAELDRKTRRWSEVVAAAPEH
jgi:DNA-binding transcriptional LysR family regulator